MTRRHFARVLLAGGAAGTLLLFGLRRARRRGVTAVDTHAHVFVRGLALSEGRRYAPDYDAPLRDYLKQLDAHGISHGVLVQPSFLGTDNSFLLAALREAPERLRGIAVVDPTVSSAALDGLAAGGVVGIRLNLLGRPIPDFGEEPWRPLLRNLARLRWQVEVHREGRDLPTIVGPLLDAGLNVVVDHFGRPDPALGTEDPGFRYLLSPAVRDTRRLWVKLSGAYRNGANGRGDAIARAAAPLLLEALGPERLLWGSDWPHTQFEREVDYGKARAALDAWVGNPEQRETILGRAPSALFRF